MNLNDYENLDELEEELLKTKKFKQDGKAKRKNKNAKNFYEPQGMPFDWRKGDSHIGRQKKRRNRNI